MPGINASAPAENFDASREAIEAINATLRACPHCGPMPAKPELVRCETSNRYQVYCGPCGSSSGSTRTPQAAADLWNSRHVGDAEIGSTGAACTDLAIYLGNRLADLSENPATPRYGFASPERQSQAYTLSREIIWLLNRQLAAPDLINSPAEKG